MEDVEGALSSDSEGGLETEAMEDVEGALSSDSEGGLETEAAAGGPSAPGPDGMSSDQTPAGPLPAVPNSNVGQEVSKTNFRQTVCRHWLKSLCVKGDKCRFLHQYDKARMPMCRFFVTFGKCREPDCIFKHNNDDIRECNITTGPKIMTEMDKRGELSPHLDDGSEDINNRKVGLESADTSKLSDEAVNQQNCGKATQRHESGGSSGKRRESRWNPMHEEGGVANGGECSSKKKRSRWAAKEPKISLPGQIDFEEMELNLKPMHEEGGVANEGEYSGKKKRSRWATEEPKISLLGKIDFEEMELNLKLFSITKRLQSGNVIVASGDGQRSPSPEPQYNNLGIRINTREVRAREKLIQERKMTIVRLIQKNPDFRPPADSKFFEYCTQTQVRKLEKTRCHLCGQQGHKQFTCPVRQMACGDEHSTINTPTKVSLPGAKLDITNPYDLCFEFEKGRSAVSIEQSGSGTSRQSIQPLGPTDNYMSRLTQAGGLNHPQNGNAGIEPELMRVLMEKRGSGLPIQFSQPPAFTDNYMSCLAGSLENPENGNARIVPGKVSLEKNGFGLRGQSTQQLGLTDTYITWLAGGKEHAENVNAGMGPERRKVSIEKTEFGLPRQSTQSMGLTDNYMSWLTGGLQRPESGKDEIGAEMRKVSLEKSGSGIPRQSSQSLGLRDSYMSWLAEGLEHTSDGSAGIGPDKRAGGGFGTSSLQGTRPYVYSPYSSHVGVESSFESPSFSHSHTGLGPPLEHNSHGKEIDTQPPRLPVRSGAYAQPSWSAPTRSVSSAPCKPYSDNNGSGITSHSVSPLQRDTFNSLLATSNCTYGSYQIPMHSAETSSVMQGPPKSQLVLGNVHDSLMSKLNIHSADAMTHFSPNQARITTFQRYAHQSIPSDIACSESPSQGSLTGGLVTPPWSSSLFSSAYQKKAVELEYEKFLAETGP